ncbi:MAG: hypothetical protein Q4A65_02335 [Bacillota bacterium]|nr:hypothetical protein [Bacillota bacterium]
MRTAEERIAVLHKRTKELKRERDRIVTNIWGSFAIILFFALIGANLKLGERQHSIMGEQFAGSSLISENAGGQVLIAVISFMAGVIITAMIIRTRGKGQGR